MSIGSHLDRGHYRQHLCRVGRRHSSCSLPPCIPAVQLAHAERYRSVLHRHQDLRDLVPLDPERFPLRHCDLSIQQQFVDEFVVREVNKDGAYRSSSSSVEVAHTRLDLVALWSQAIQPDRGLSSEDAVGNEADQLEFRYRDSNNRIDIKCSRTSVPGTWLTVSHISGPTLVQTIRSVRENRARVEGPEQTEQFAQLAAVHEGWWNSSIARDETQVGSLVVFVEGLDEGNFHIQVRSKLLERTPLMVAQRALAEMRHEAGVAAPIGPPSLTATAWIGPDVDDDARGSGDDQVLARQHAGAELNVRSFSTTLVNRGQSGHQVDAERDTARLDRSFARSTAGLTPQLFAEEMARRSYNTTTATIVEIDTAGGAEDVQTGPVQAAQSQASAPAGAPVSYAPQLS